ncbi:hypothetical protein JOQ06_017733 [Pogonophryne albipinna]|uniref:ATP-dependent RNA helicase n=1 Tax=Pogonophryne albipinna TaxID=1090488 RepID=A0AAD6F3X5_9TELE|nr:hypothetical protein JOQ06_017733 [Pogonophryne albipinna]
MSEDQLCLNISVSSSPSLRRKPLTTQQRWAKPPPPAERADRKAPQKKKDGGGAVWQPPPPAERADRRAPQKKKDGGVKTSSLFKHNPDIPALLSPVVSQVKEKIFTSDSFSDMDLHPHLVATLNKVLNVSTVTSVQKQTMPVLLSGRDAVVRSQTGSGKTLAYAVPVVQSLQALQQKVSRSDGPLAVIIVPTREVCGTHYLPDLPEASEAVHLIVPGGSLRRPGSVRGSTSWSRPRAPGDHIKNTLVIAFSSVRWLILDEADRILDLGFEKDLTVILNSLNTTGPSRQNVLLSATLSQGVTRLADVCLNDPVTINVSGPASSDLTVPAKDPGSADQSESFTLPEALQQFVVVVPSKVRLVCLAAFILHKGLHNDVTSSPPIGLFRSLSPASLQIGGV